jgi:hypothetical protein
MASQEVKRWAYGVQARTGGHGPEPDRCQLCGCINRKVMERIVDTEAEAIMGSRVKEGDWWRRYFAARMIALKTIDDMGEKLVGHHFDYARPSEMIWLCTYCHARAHGRVNTSRGQLDIFKPFTDRRKRKNGATR